MSERDASQSGEGPGGIVCGWERKEGGQGECIERVGEALDADRIRTETEK